MPGYIDKEYVVWCDCANWNRLLRAKNKKAAIAVWRKRGWTHTVADGWRCPLCSALDTRSRQ